MRGDKIIYAIVLLLFNYEYMKFGEGFSVFRVLMFPIMIIGFLRLSNIYFSKEKFTFTAVSSLFLTWSLLSSINESDFFSGIINIVGLILFISYFMKFLQKYNAKSVSFLTSLILFSYSIPYIIYFFFFYTGGRFDGIHKDPNFAGGYITLSLAASIYLFYSLRNTKYKNILKIIFLLNIVMCLYLILQTGSRSGFIFSLLTCFLSLFFLLNKFFKIVFIVLLIILVQLILHRISTITWSSNLSSLDYVLWRFSTVQDTENFSRLRLLRDFISVIDQNIFYGMGPNNFVKKFGHFPHNLALDIFVNTGIIVGSMYILYLSKIFFKSVKKQLRLKQFNPYLFYSISGLLVFLSLSAFSSKLFWLLIVFLVYSNYGNYNKQTKTPSHIHPNP